MSPETLDVVVAQTAPLRGRPEENARDLGAAVRAAAGADLIVFPELALTGYLLGDRAPEMALEPEREPFPLDLPGNGPAVALGYVERARTSLVYNAAVVLRGPEILARHRKIHLPTYGMFDEGRTFAPGRRGPSVFELGPWRIGLLVCEELWHPALAYLLALQGADAILVLAAAAGRGRPKEGRGPLFASTDAWELLARAAAFNHGLWVVVANRVGVEEGLTFAGGSVVVSPDGAVAARAPQGETARLRISLDRAAVAAARRRFSHLRDEDPGLVARELRRIGGWA